MSYVVAIGLVLLLVINGYATSIILKSDDFQRSQKRNQLIFTWAVPLVGAAIVIAFHWSMNDKDPPDDGDNQSDMSDDQLRKYWIGAPR